MSKDHMPPPTPQELVSQLKEQFQKFLAVCEELSSNQAYEPGICGEWSAKAVVDHLTGWQVQSLPIVKQLLSSEKKEFEYDIDAFNRTSVTSRADLSWEESLEAFRDSFNNFDEALGDIPVARFRTNEGFKSWLKAMIHEYRFHLQHIQKAQQQ
ncbi:MAG: maleylpyruvate isomerase N-terminal domain-containing protein [Brevefilum sp.]